MAIIEQIRSTQNEYASFDRRYSGHNRTLIDGTITGCGNCVGYCKYIAHPGFLTKKQRMEHDCLGKGCFYYIAKPKKERGSITNQSNAIEKVLHMASAITAEMEGIKVLSVRLENDNACVVRYVAISNCYPISALENRLSQMSNLFVRMNRIECDYERSVELIFA